jgi:hypothetical protein
MKNQIIISVLVTLMLFKPDISTSQPSNKLQYANIVYDNNKSCLNNTFFTIYESIYNANVHKLCKNKRDRNDYDRISNYIRDFLINPNVTIVYDKYGNISFSGLYPMYSGIYCDKSMSGKEQKNNAMAAKIYGTILNTTIREWYNNLNNFK